MTPQQSTPFMRMVRCPKLCSDLVAELCLGEKQGHPGNLLLCCYAVFILPANSVLLIMVRHRKCSLRAGHGHRMGCMSLCTHICVLVGMCTCVRMPVFLRVFPLVCLSIFAHVCGSQGVRMYTPAQCVS